MKAGFTGKYKEMNEMKEVKGNAWRGFVLAVLLALFAGVAVSADAVDLNTADAATLQTLGSIGPARAEAIIAYREENGGFKSVDELVNVSGIGIKTVESLREQLTVSAGDS